jgi:hypothetical protein
MNRTTSLFLAGCLGGMALLSLPALADSERGRLLYENHCTGCHESTLHVREDREAGSLAQVRSQIRRWHQYLGLPWSARDVEDVLVYLNECYYRFSVAPEAGAIDDR